MRRCTGTLATARRCYEVVRSVMASTADAARRAAAEEDDRMAAVSRFMHAAAAAQIAALCPLLPTATPELSTEKLRLIDTGEALVVRAQDAGRMRADVTFADLLMALAQLTRPFPGVAADRFTGRNLQVYLDGLAAPAPSALTGPPPPVEDLRQTGNNLRQNRNEN